MRPRADLTTKYCEALGLIEKERFSYPVPSGDPRVVVVVSNIFRMPLGIGAWLFRHSFGLALISCIQRY